MRLSTKIVSFTVAILLVACMGKNELILRFEGVDKIEVRISLEIEQEFPLTEIFDGRQQRDVPNVYGPHHFYFTYKNLHAMSGHFKTNRRNGNDYVFVFKEKDGRYFVDVDISGGNDIRETVELK